MFRMRGYHPPGKVIVHGISTNCGDSASPQDSTNRIKIELERVLEKYGPATCIYFESEKTSKNQPNPSAAKKIKMDEVGKQEVLVVHVLFENAEDAARACQAAANNEVILSDNVLILTLMPESSQTIENLDDNSLLKIFSMLNPKDKLTIEEVCIRWKKLMKYSWPDTKTLRLEEFDFPASKFRKYLIRCGEYLKLLKCSVTSRTLLNLILKYCKKLETLELDVDLEDSESAAFCKMFTELQNLTNLKLIHRDKIFDMRFMECLPESMEKISLSCVCGSRGTVYFDLFEFPNLQSLYLSAYKVHLEHLVGAENLRHLTHLEFNDCQIYRRITRNFQHLTTLKTMNISRSGITDDILIKILQNNPGIEFLDISQSSAVSDRSVQVASTLANLKVLNVSKLPVTFRFMDEMPSLERLECQECNELTNERVVELIQLAPKLQHLNLCDSSITKALFPLVNAALERRDNNIQLKILTTESSDEWKCLVNLSPLLEIERTEGMKSDRLLLEQFGWHEDSDDMNDERSHGSSTEEDSDY